MSIIDPQLVNIEIAILPDRHTSGLRLNYQGKVYDLVQAFSDRKLDFAQRQLRTRWERQLSQPSEIDRECGGRAATDRYLLLREVGYYSLWELARSTGSISPSIDRVEDDRHPDLGLQQASIWLFQELWIQWQDLLGINQLPTFVDNLLTVVPHLRSWVDLDRLLVLDPLAIDRLDAWSEQDFMAFDRQLYHLTQKKIGREFGTKLTIEIINSMPDFLRSRLTEILDI